MSSDDEFVKTKFSILPQLFRRKSSLQQRQDAPSVEWPRRPHANSSASALTAVAPEVPHSLVGKGGDGRSAKSAGSSQVSVVETRKQRKLHRRPTKAARPSKAEQRRKPRDEKLEQFPEPLPENAPLHEQSGEHGDNAVQLRVPSMVRRPAEDRAARLYSGKQLGIAEGHALPNTAAATKLQPPEDVQEDLAFWRVHDRRIGEGGELTRPRQILDSMVDDAKSDPRFRGWDVEPGQGTFNDVLGIGAIHPVVLAFARAHVEKTYVSMGPEHVWLAVLQGLAATMRQNGSHSDKQAQGVLDSPVPGGHGSPAEGSEDSDVPVDLAAVWRQLRESSDVPRSCVASSSGHEVRLFPTELHDGHTLHSGRGAAPLAMAAAASGHQRKQAGAVDYGRIEIGQRFVSWQPRRRNTNPQWIAAMGSENSGILGMVLTGTLQAWSSLCVLARQLKESFSGKYGRAFDWWLHRVHLLARDLADYYAAQEETGGDLPDAWRQWLSLALFDGHSGAQRGARLDGWLVALFALDADGAPIHERHRWWVEWDRVPSGIDLLRSASPAAPAEMMNMYSGFVGVQVLRRSSALGSSGPRARNLSGTLQGEDLEAAFDMARDGARTLTGSQEQLVVDAITGEAARVASQADLDAAFASLCEAEATPVRAIAPLIGWALDG
ncbi:hypothetical protein GGF46_002668 [Coemansia sp. RSA 552]|nr:hypothetical protein GGF46_002668 [Coemansia sp. RSA 552]